MAADNPRLPEGTEGWRAAGADDARESRSAPLALEGLEEAADVVATGLKDLYQTKKDVSIHGLPVRNQVRLVKLLPHSLVMKVWLNQQKKPKNNHGLTTD